MSPRLDLPTDQKMYLFMADFLRTSALFGDSLFRIDAHKGTARVDRIDPTSKLVLQSATYIYATADHNEIERIEAAIGRDFAGTGYTTMPPSITNS